ncbi:hypothetical protein KKB44_05060 [Candidatus Micrarchaeota archaeon]|nr:hypothetical protein [Candidatus Micrarchaeota archaeon]
MLRYLIIGLFVFGLSFACNVDEDCLSAGTGNVCLNGTCIDVAFDACQLDSDCPSTVPGPEYFCDVMACTETGAYLCANDDDCISAGKGNTCLAGICGFVEPAECQVDADCPLSIPGPDYICDEGLCTQTGLYRCNDDLECMDANEGNECAQGTCLYVSKPPPNPCSFTFALLGMLAFVAFKR